MKAIAPKLFTRGQSRNFYLRRRIPTALLEAYPPKKTHIVVCLGTSDKRRAEELQRIEEVRIDAEFSRLKDELKAKSVLKARVKVTKLTDAHIRSMADFWVRQTLLGDDYRRVKGLDEDEFVSLDQQLTAQRAELGRMLAMGRTDKILPALHSFLYLCGLDVDLTAEDSHRIGYQFLRAVVTALDAQLERQQGTQVDVDVVAPATASPKELVVQEMLSTQASENAVAQAAKDEPSWDEIFILWRDHVRDRPKSTAIATKTPWNELQRIAAAQGIMSPSKVTPELMETFVEGMNTRLEVVTLNERLAKVKSVFKLAFAKRKLPFNPAASTIGKAEHSLAKRIKRRLPFDSNDLNTIFSSVVFNECQLRSQGQAGEATYWLPVLMFYTGARPEEMAGLAVTDIKNDPVYGWYFDIVDHPDGDDDVFDDEKKVSKKGKGKSSDAPKGKLPVRILKNRESIRKVPMATQLIDLGFLRYIEWVKAQGQQALFPTLSRDWHGKLCGAFSKFFGRYKLEVLGIENPKKVLYSFRHGMKDFMTRARIPSKYLQRILGHATGDGEITDGYGEEDLPLEFLADEFKKINFPNIPAHPWMPGKGFVRLKQKPGDADVE